jgi:hypothetical protein
VKNMELRHHRSNTMFSAGGGEIQIVRIDRSVVIWIFRS